MNAKTHTAQALYNLSYGADGEQVMDLYLPAAGATPAKTFVLLHSGGSRSGMNHVVQALQDAFPGHAIANMDYRLATAGSPAFPKQIQDIEKAIQFLLQGGYSRPGKLAFIGISAGAHLALLYAYRHDAQRQVKAVCSIVGPADFTDPFYVNHPYYNYAALFLLGNAARQPEAVLEISPARFVNPLSPPTLLFYSGKYPLVPASQGDRLKAKLDHAGVSSNYYRYKEGGHGGWNAAIMESFRQKLVAFMQEYFD